MEGKEAQGDSPKKGLNWLEAGMPETELASCRSEISLGDDEIRNCLSIVLKTILEFGHSGVQVQGSPLSSRGGLEDGPRTGLTCPMQPLLGLVLVQVCIRNACDASLQTPRRTVY